MEVLVNWNVYKMFKNGKRAKAPMTVFEFDGDEREAETYFRSIILENFNEKNRGSDFSILRADLPQERLDPNKKNNEILRKQVLVLAKAARKKNITHSRKTTTGLMFASATYWKWQWCILESGTNNFVAGLSPRFDNSGEADKWMNQQIKNLK
tara:strand:- start:3896 stop:4354 length:459 start_codon:yes stop_codon:yes gene_type:complete